MNHHQDCEKVKHTGGGYLHGDNDDGPYDVDGLEYCGRCHAFLKKTVYLRVAPGRELEVIDALMKESTRRGQEIIQLKEELEQRIRDRTTMLENEGKLRGFLDRAIEQRDETLQLVNQQAHFINRLSTEGATVLEALKLAEEELDLVRRELKLSGSEQDDALELTYAKVTAAILLMEPKP